MGQPESVRDGAEVTLHPSSLHLIKAREVGEMFEHAAIAEVVWSLSQDNLGTEEVWLMAWAGLTNDQGLLSEERKHFAEMLGALELPEKLEVVREALRAHPNLAAT